MPASKKQISDQAPAFKTAEETKKVDLTDGDSSQQVSIGSNMDPKYEGVLMKFLRKNKDIFA